MLVLTTTGKAAIPVSRRVRLPVAVRPNPGLTVKARDLTVPQGGSTQILVDASQPSVLYQLMAGAAAVGGPVTGTGAPIALPVGPLAATTAFSVVASRVNPPAGSVTLSTTVTVTVKP